MKSERETGDGAGKLQIEDPSRGRKLRGEQGQEMELILLKCVCGGAEKRGGCVRCRPVLIPAKMI